MRVEASDRSAQGDDRRRAQLLEAAGRVWVRRPTGGLTMASVAAEAGVSTRLMYYYFADIQALYDELFHGRLTDHVGNVDKNMAAGPPETPAERVGLAVRLFLELPATYRQWALMAVMDTLPAELQSQGGALLELITSRWVDMEPFVGLEPDTMTMVMGVVITTVCQLGRAMDDGMMTREQAVEVSVATIFALAQTTREVTKSGPT